MNATTGFPTSRRGRRWSTPLARAAGAVAALAVLAALADHAHAAKYKEIVFVNDWSSTGAHAIKVSAPGSAACIWTPTFPGGATASSPEECAAAFVAHCNAGGVFTCTVINATVRICHPTKQPKVEKKNLENYRLNSEVYFNDPSTALASTNLIEVRGMALGGGMVTLGVDDLLVQVPTLPDQTSEEIVDALVEALDAAVPDDTEHTFGAEHTTAEFGTGPIDAADLGIHSLGARDLSTTFFFSDDAGILMEQDPIALPTCPWSEDFEPYTQGAGLHGLGGWKGWDDDPSFDATVTDALARTGNHSVEIDAGADLVHELCTTGSGAWAFSAWQYIPAEFAAGGGAAPPGTYLVLLDTYDDGGPYHWSMQMQFDPGPGRCYVWDGAGVGLGSFNVPYVTDRWARIRTIIDLDEDWTRVYYDDKPVAQYSWTGGVLGNAGGALDLGAADLFANGSSAVFYDDVKLENLTPPCGGGLLDDIDADGLDLLSEHFEETDPCEPDSDGDAILDGPDNCPLEENPDQTDYDDDAIGDACDAEIGCPLDLDSSGDVGFGDLTNLLIAWGPCAPDPEPCPADADGTGDVGFGDLTKLLIKWGECPG